MAGTIVADTLTHSTAGSLTTDYVVNGSAKAWVHAEGNVSGAAAADSFNVSSMADNGTGDYDMNMSNSMSSARYMAAVTMGDDQDSSNGSDLVGSAGMASSSTVRMRSHNTTSHVDAPYAGCATHGDLA
jgi:hypothetical protein